MKITKEMVEQAYEHAKKVYHGQLTRSEAKTEISKVTGMNSGSAQDYITVF
jgi:ribosomal protein RSM22 (predicted rRNA methylase)